MKIRIDATHAEKINAAIKAAEGKATARKITADDIIDCVDRINRHLGIPKCKMDGCAAYCDVNAQRYPNAYRGIPQSTQFRAENIRGNWYLTDVSRCNQTGTVAVLLDLTDAAKAAILEAAACIRN